MRRGTVAAEFGKLGQRTCFLGESQEVVQVGCVLVIGIPFGLSVELTDNVEDGIVLCGAAYGNAQAVFQKRMCAVQF